MSVVVTIALSLPTANAPRLNEHGTVAGKPEQLNDTVPMNPPTGDTAIVTVTYRNADSDRREGTLVEGQKVTIKNGTIFNVTATTRS